MDMQKIKSFKKLRKEDRQDTVKPVFFPGQKTGEPFAFSLNASQFGTCIVTSRDISPGDVITIYCKEFWNKPVKAKAMWGKSIYSHLNKIGFRIHQDDQ